MRWIVGVWLLSAAAGALLLWQGLFSAAELERLVERCGVWAPASYLALYLVAPVLLLPGAPLAIAGGALFGPLEGATYALFGATGGAALAFSVARRLARPWVEQRVGGQLARIQAGVEAAGWRFVLLARASPLVPYNLLNYALGLTRIGLVPYTLATAAGIVPVLAGYALLGHAGRAALEGQAEAAGRLLVALAALNLAVAVPWLALRLRRGPRTRTSGLGPGLERTRNAHPRP
jgi:uncharacterized membrane protein YdjX (TVP38/TMEM64 family)